MPYVDRRGGRGFVNVPSFPELVILHRLAFPKPGDGRSGRRRSRLNFDDIGQKANGYRSHVD